MKIKEVLIKVAIQSKIYMGDSQFTTKDGLLNLHLNRRTHWNFFINGKSFVSFWFPPPKIKIKINDKRNGKCVLSKYKKQGKDNYCAALCLYIFF